MRYFLPACFLFIFFFRTPLVFAGDVVLNEFFSNGSSDWVEIYNNSSNSVDLSLYRLRDSSATNKVELSGSLGAGGFATFDWSDKLNNTGDIIKLVLVSDDSVIDQVGYGDAGSDVTAPSIGQSAGRPTDGNTSWGVLKKKIKRKQAGKKYLTPSLYTHQ